jgi:hypothetical protein
METRGEQAGGDDASQGVPAKAADQKGEAGAEDAAAQTDVKMRSSFELADQLETEAAGGLKRKAEGSPEHSDKEVKKEKSE